METNQIILDELRAFRSEINSWRQEMTERVATLEAHDKDISGNGQPGRVTILERRMDDLTAWKWRIVGISSGIAGVVSVVGWVLKR